MKVKKECYDCKVVYEISEKESNPYGIYVCKQCRTNKRGHKR